MGEIKFEIISGNKIIGYECFSASMGWYHVLYSEPEDSRICHTGVFTGMARKRRQYTGLKDKNGKEIYEGDLLQTTHRVRFGTQVSGRGRNRNTYSLDKTITECGVVCYEKGKWLVKFLSFHDYDSYFFCSTAKDRPRHVHEQVIEDLANDQNHYIQVGNIYENPELLPGTQPAPTSNERSE